MGNSHTIVKQIEKRVRSHLPKDFYGTVKIESDNAVVNITSKTIKETFNMKNFGKLPRLNKVYEIALIEDIKDILSKAEPIMYDVPNKHSENKTSTYDYYQTRIIADDEDLLVYFDIRKGKDSKRLYLYRVNIEKRSNSDLPHENREDTKTVRPYSDTLPQSSESGKRNQQYRFDDGQFSYHCKTNILGITVIQKR